VQQEVKIVGDDGNIHGGKLPNSKVAKVRYNGKWWLRVWATPLPGGGVRVEPSEYLPRGGNWNQAESYFI
jgi:hypothetical protein